MSSAVSSTSAAQSRPFFLEVEDAAEVCPPPAHGEGRPPQRVPAAGFSEVFLSGKFKDGRLAGVTSASRMAVRSAPEMVSSGIPAIDVLTGGGLPRGCLTEISGPASSGRTTLLLAALAAATRRGEFCVIVDASDALHPQSAADAGVELARLLWVRCGEDLPRRSRSTTSSDSAKSSDSDKEKKNPKFHEDRSQYAEHRLEQLLRAADLLLESGGFGLIALDLGDLLPQAARRIPLATWFRFRRAVEHTATVLLAIERQFIAGNCASLLIQLGPAGNQACESTASQFAAPAHVQLLTGLEITAELVRSRLERKPVRSAEITFASKTAWAG